MDKLLFSTKHISLYFTTLKIGFGITMVPHTVVPRNKSFHLLLGVLELVVYTLEDW